MSLTKKEKETVEAYDAQAKNWTSQHQTPGFWKKEMDKFQDLLASGKILEIGSGGGRDAKELRKRGYLYTGTDVSEGLIRQARKANPNTTFIHQSVYDLDFPKDSFDGFWASAVLLHIPKDRISEALAKIHDVVKPDGIGFISVKEGEGEKMVSEDVQIGNMGFSRFFSFFKREEFAEILKNNGYEILEFIYHPMSEKTKWLVFFVKVKKS